MTSTAGSRRRTTTTPPFLFSALILSLLASQILGAAARVRVPSNYRFPNPNLRRAYIALQALKNSIHSDPRNITHSWNSSNVCSYEGVFCAPSPANRSLTVVAGIDLNHEDIAGSLPPELGLLTDLALFHINSNRFCGVVPKTLARLRLLFELDLSNNRFVGGFPRVLLNLPSLKFLDLRFNEFEGPVPPEVFDKDLDAVFLNHNRFQFSLPPNLGNSPVSVLVLASNNFGGCIPASIGRMGGTLNELILMNDNLTDCLTPQIGNLTELTVLDVSFNRLRGPLPGEIRRMRKLEQLNVAHNRLTGVVPGDICQLPRLENFTYSYNYFTGVDPACGRPTFDGQQNCIANRTHQRSGRECSSEGARPFDCSRSQCGGGGGGGRSVRPGPRRRPPVGRPPSPRPSLSPRPFIQAPPPTTRSSRPRPPPPPPLPPSPPSPSLSPQPRPPPSPSSPPPPPFPPPPSPPSPSIDRRIMYLWLQTSFSGDPGYAKCCVMFCITAGAVAGLYVLSIQWIKWYALYTTHMYMPKALNVYGVLSFSTFLQALPQFGIHTNVRVCADCFNDGSRSRKDTVPANPNEINAVGDSISRLDISTVSDTKPEAGTAKSSFPDIFECKCGMPLCICQAPEPPNLLTTTSSPPLNSIPKQKKTEPTPRSRGSSSNCRQSTLFNPGQVGNSSVDTSSINYEVTGEGLREAIKNGDAPAAKKLLSQGVDANYRDKQGSSLLHLASVFNHTEIAFALIDHGAHLDCKNSQGETPLDCAPATLQYRIKQKMEEDKQSLAHE
ncbi:leucine-rich repeat/extensin [Striga asiatica]|uniref:Cell wall hydroxyproline-rich glycoprotein n=1 Tax=Striga asiatica TaxID=4170 RepID=A0A5A7Q9Z9_STRAF|nr:leucine-rich repeat/extensin [Striga asiatica]